jgi:6,7-dimethyl-8-ribityllumazine synthase
MASELKNLSDYSNDDELLGSSYSIGIVTAEWNTEITTALKEACKQTLIKHKVKDSNIFELSVPGSFELPLGATILDSKYKLDAVICLGCVIKGETTHNEYINQTVAQALMHLSIARYKPFVFGLLTPNTLQQALDRAGGKHGNKGTEAAYTALRMCKITTGILNNDQGIGFKVR